MMMVVMWWQWLCDDNWDGGSDDDCDDEGFFSTCHKLGVFNYDCGMWPWEHTTGVFCNHYFFCPSLPFLPE